MSDEYVFVRAPLLGEREKGEIFTIEAADVWVVLL